MMADVPLFLFKLGVEGIVEGGGRQFIFSLSLSYVDPLFLAFFVITHALFISFFMHLNTFSLSHNAMLLFKTWI